MVSIAIFGVLVAGLAGAMTQNYLWRLPVLTNGAQQRAIVIDQLSLNYPDPLFVINLTNTLQSAGYAVDYIGPSPTVVDTLKQLPSQGYDLVIIRAHSASSQSIITTEPYSTSTHLDDQQSGTLVPAEVGSGPIYFAITPSFVRQDMNGRFAESTVVVMGCSTLLGPPDLASAFLDKGAKYFVGWSGSVSIIHTDTSTVQLARLLAAGKNLPEAAGKAAGEDPVYGAKLEYLDWNSLVNSRISILISQATIWLTLGSLLVIGPTTVFLGPKALDLLWQLRSKTERRKSERRTSKAPSIPNRQ